MLLPIGKRHAKFGLSWGNGLGTLQDATCISGTISGGLDRALGYVSQTKREMVPVQPTAILKSSVAFR